MNDPSGEAGDSNCHRTRLQFNLRDLLLLTFALALTLGLSTWLGPLASGASSATLGAWLDCRARVAMQRPLIGAGILGGMIGGAINSCLFALMAVAFKPLLFVVDGAVLGALMGAAFGNIYRRRWERNSLRSRRKA